MKQNLSVQEVQRIKELRERGEPYEQIAIKTGRARSTVYKVCNTGYMGAKVNRREEPKYNGSIKRMVVAHKTNIGAPPINPDSTTIVISWKQLSLIPESATKTAILHALDIQVPPQGVSKQFQLSEKPGEETVTYTEDGFVYYKDRSSIQRANGSSILKLTRRPKGTPSGDALRAWLRRWGWVPKSELETNAKAEVSS